MSENAKRAQVLWTLALALLALLGAAAGKLPRPNISNPLPDPAPDPGSDPDQSPEPGENPSGEPTAPPEDSPTGGEEPTPVPDPNEPAPGDSGQPAPAPSPPSDDPVSTQPVDPAPGGDGEHVDAPDSSPNPSNLPGNPLDGYPGHGSADDGGEFSDIPGYAEDALDDDPSAELTWAGKMASDVIGEAENHPEAAVLIVGAPAGAYLLAGGTVTAVGASTASSLAAAGVTRKEVTDAEATIRSWYSEGGSSDPGDGDTDLPPGREPGHGSRDGDDPADPAPAPGDDPGDEDDVADPGDGEGGHVPAPGYGEAPVVPGAPVSDPGDDSEPDQPVTTDPVTPAPGDDPADNPVAKHPTDDPAGPGNGGHVKL